MKNNLNWFRHDAYASQHWKFKVLRKKYNWGGDGKFWALNSIICLSENCTLDLTNEDFKNEIAATLDFEPQEFEEFLQYLIKPCKLLINSETRQWDENVPWDKLTTDELLTTFVDISANREQERVRKKEYRKHQIHPESVKIRPDKQNVRPENEIVPEGHLTDQNQNQNQNQSKNNKKKINSLFSEKKANPKKQTNGHPVLSDVIKFFEANDSNAISAKAFFNRFNSFGWKTKEHQPIEDYSGLALNWIERGKEMREDDDDDSKPKMDKAELEAKRKQQIADHEQQKRRKQQHEN